MSIRHIDLTSSSTSTITANAMQIPTRPFPFLRLPSELRIKIYNQILGGRIIHIGGTAHQPYTDSHISNGRCCSCVSRLDDQSCFAKYTGAGKALVGKVPADRFSARHRDCFRYPVSHTLNLGFLSVCKQIHAEAASIVFEENIFTLVRPTALPLFLDRLAPSQSRNLRQLRIYSAESRVKWLGNLLRDTNLADYLHGFQRLEVYVELKPFDVETHGMRIVEEQRWRLAGAEVFKLASLREVQLMIVTPEWTDVEKGELSEATTNALQQWEMELRYSLMPLLPLQVASGLFQVK